MTAADLGDAGARDLISRSGLDQTLFVEAGAGTGKTTQLVDRIVNLVLGESGGVGRPPRLNDVAAITFTEAAASELQARIRVRFVQELESDDPVRRERAEQALSDIDVAAISTVHGFASRLLGEFSVLAGLPPRITVLDEVSSLLAREQRWERFVDLLNDDEAFADLMGRAAILGISLTPRYQGEASMREVANYFAQHWDRLADVVDSMGATSLRPPDFTGFVAAVDDLEAALDLCSDPNDKLYQHIVRIVADMRAIVAIDEPDRILRQLQQRRVEATSGDGVPLIWTKTRSGRKESWEEEPAEVRQRIVAVNAAVVELLQQQVDDVLAVLVRLVATEVLQAAQQRQQSGGLEFHDLLVLARSALRDSAEVRSFLHDRYRHILLDEFQDTDPIQIELATLIAASEPTNDPGSWDQLDIDAGRLFFVGDPKQSIYRFRRADISLFLKARSVFGEAAGGTPTVQLDTNFRTVEPIINWTNAFFGAQMAEEVPGAQPKYQALRAHRVPESSAEHRPRLLGGCHPDELGSAPQLRTAEAADVADTIASIVAHPDRWPVFDERRERWRPAKLSDITILIPTRTSLPFLRDALRARDLPYRLAIGTLVYNTQEVSDLLAALRVIDDPTDALSLIAALRSPLYGCSDVDLFTYHQANPKWVLSAGDHGGLPDEHPVVGAIEHLYQLWSQRWWLSPAVLLDRLIAERHGFLLAYGTERPEEVWRRLRFLLDQARAFEESSGGDLRSFLDWAELQSADSARVHEPLLPETDDEALKIMTVHGSKGLEFPITILAGLTTKAQGRRGGVSVVWDDQGHPQVSLRKTAATSQHSPRADLEVVLDDHEKMRLLYVAATRARDHLIVSGHHSAKNGHNAARQFADFAAEHPELFAPTEGDHHEPNPNPNPDTNPDPDTDPAQSGSVRVDTSEPAGPPSQRSDTPEPEDGPRESRPDTTERAGWIARRADLVAPAGDRSTWSATAVAQSVDASISDTDTDEPGDTRDAGADDTPARPDFARRRGRAGSAVGSAVHATLEVINFDDPHDLEALVRRQCELHDIADLYGTVSGLVASALGSEAVALARRHRSYREIYVAAPVGTVTVEGYIDLLIETPDGLVVVDYKTDRANSEREINDKLAAYELQGAAYAVALEASTGLEVVECRFVFCKASGAIERSVADLVDAKQRVRLTVGAEPDGTA